MLKFVRPPPLTMTEIIKRIQKMYTNWIERYGTKLGYFTKSSMSKLMVLSPNFNLRLFEQNLQNGGKICLDSDCWAVPGFLNLNDCCSEIAVHLTFKAKVELCCAWAVVLHYLNWANFERFHIHGISKSESILFVNLFPISMQITIPLNVFSVKHKIKGNFLENVNMFSFTLEASYLPNVL